MKTKIRKTEKGHQTFFLQEQLPEEGMTSLKYARWYEKQLKLAFKSLIKNHSK